MNNRYRILIIVVCIVILWKTVEHFNNREHLGESAIHLNENENYSNEKIKVTVYYEALCSDSRNFIIKQLKPTYERLRNYLLLEFIPYGKAETTESNGQISFKCQHGSTECVANKVHACVLDKVKEQDTRLEYISCMINDNIMPHEAGQRCGDELKINYEDIMECSNDSRGSTLLKMYGERTQAVNPVITFIPTIQINESMKISQSKLLKNLLKELCGLLEKPPNDCSL